MKKMKRKKIILVFIFTSLNLVNLMGYSSKFSGAPRRGGVKLRPRKRVWRQAPPLRDLRFTLQKLYRNHTKKL